MSIVVAVLLLAGLFILLGVVGRGKGHPGCSTETRESPPAACDTCPIAPRPLSETASPKIDWWAPQEPGPRRPPKRNNEP